MLLSPVIDSAVDLWTTGSGNTGNTGSAGRNSRIFPGRRTNQSIGPIHRASLATAWRACVFLTGQLFLLTTDSDLC